MPIRQEDKGNTKIVKLGQKRQGQRIKVEPFGQEEEKQEIFTFQKMSNNQFKNLSKYLDYNQRIVSKTLLNVQNSIIT